MSDLELIQNTELLVKIKRIMSAYDLNQSEVTELLGLGKKTISRWKAKKWKPTRPMLKLADLMLENFELRARCKELELVLERTGFYER